MMNAVIEDNQREVRVTFIVTVPTYTKPDDIVYMVGNHPKIGNWEGKPYPLNKVAPYQYQASFVLPKNTHLEFKLHRGSWNTVEKDSQFHELRNRSIDINKGKVLHLKVHNWADKGKPIVIEPKARNIDIKIHRNFRATKLNNERTIWVYLPPSYHRQPKKKYPVLYTHDGNNVFDKETSFLGIDWELDDTAERLIQEEQIREVIIVAIENTHQRNKEYTHVYDPEDGGGKANLYADFIIHDLRPFINKEYRTLKDRQYTGIMGSSLGGLASLYMSWQYPHIFSMAGVVSPSIWWANRDILDMVRKTKKKPPIKIWLDIGTLEGYTEAGRSQAVHDTRLLRDALLDKGFRLHHDLEYMEVEGAEHNEAAWARRVDKILLFFYGSKFRSIRGFFRTYL